MAHEIRKNDHMLSVGQVPWHGLGTVLPEHPSTQEAIKIAKLDWTVEKVALRTSDGFPVGDFFATRRADQPGDILGIVSADYQPVQNADAFRIGDILLGEKQARVETAGSLRDCRTVWMLFRLSGEQAVVGNDTVESYLLATTSHDGTQSLTWMPTNVRVVCNNTLTWALADRRRAYRFVHRRNVEGQMAEAAAYLRWAMRETFGTVEQFRALAHRPVGSAEVEGYFRRVFPDTYKDSTKRMVEAAFREDDRRGDPASGEAPDAGPLHDRERCLALFEGGTGTDISGVRGTAWAALNAVTEHVDHGCGLSQTAEQSMWRRLYGTGADVKRRAYREAMALLKR